MKHFDWQLRMEAFLKTRQNMSFAWGRNDCATFAADCVLALAGKDHGVGLRGHTTALQAARTLKRHGGLVAIATAALGAPIPSAFAQIGDVVLSKAGDQDMLAICNGGTALAPGPDGLVTVAMGNYCWRVE